MTVETPLKLSHISLFYVIYRYTAGTRVFTVPASLDFISRSSDYVLSRFIFKLTLGIIA